MEILITAIIGLAVGWLCGWLWGRNKLSNKLVKAETQCDFTQQEVQRLSEANSALQKEHQQALSSLQRDMELRSNERMQALKAEFQTLSQQILEQQSQKLANSSQEGIQNILRPLQNNLVSLERAIHDSNEKGASNKSSFDDAIRRLLEQTSQVGLQAEQLTRALKGESKTQGDWGEMILNSILEHSGLRLGEEYVTQETIKDENGKNLRPDVIVRFPDKRSIVIDSKVSLTAYMDYLNATDDASQKAAITSHLQSVRKHIDELAAKDYSHVVKNADNYALLFLQSDAAYILAVKNDNKLNTYAYDKHIIMTCPTTLMMTLQIVYNIWQSDRQNRNIDTIINKANLLYDKFVGFTNAFCEVGKELKQADSAYERAFGRLSDGKGNLISQMENFRKLGISPKKELPTALKQQAGIETEENLPEDED